MAEFKTTVALEVGAQSVTMGVFTPAGNGFTLSRYTRRDILLDPVEEGMRMDYVSNAISEMVAELKVNGSDVRNVVSGQQVFMRFIKLPALDMDDIGEQVGYEAQQHIPFPLEDITYSYQVLADREDGEREVLLVAIKKDVLDNLNAQVEGSGLRTRSVDCSITSLYNAFRVSYPDETEPVMLLDIGAKTTDIIFSENGRFFTRSVTAAGAFVTNSIAREFNMSYRDAEKLKIEQGQISMGNGHTDSMTEQEASLATVIRTAMQRLSSEVQRTINHYRMQYKGNPPAKAYICGGGARMPYVVEFLQNALNIPVEFMNPLAAFSIGNKVDTEALELDMLSMGAVAGAAVTGAKVGEFNIDLVPTSVGKNRAELEMLPKVIIGGVVALAGAGFFAYASSSAANKVAAERDAATPLVQSLDRTSAEINDLTSTYEEKKDQYDRLSSMLVSRKAYARVIKCLSEKGASAGYWFTEFAPLVNYDVKRKVIEDEVKGRLINANPPTGNGTAILPFDDKNVMEDEDGNEIPPSVTAVLVCGYVYIDPEKGKDKCEEEIIMLVRDSLSRSKADSVFAHTQQQVNADRTHYCVFVKADDAAKPGQEAPADQGFIEKFKVVVPLKTPIPVPEFAPAEQ